MGRLSIELGRDLLAIPSAGAITHIINVEDPGRSLRNQVIPGTSDGTLELALDPGRYVVQTEMPSGELRVDDIEIKTGQDQKLSISAPPSRHEWLQAASWLGLTARYRLEAFIDDFDDQMADASDIPEEPRSALYAPVNRLSWRLETSVPAWEEIKATGYDEEAVMFSGFNRTDQPGRGLLRISHHDDDYLLSVPTGWPTRGGAANVEVLVSTDGPRVIIGDDEVSSVLAYLAQGNLPAAGRLSRAPSKEMLYFKQLNPLQASVGGYALLSSLEGSENLDWFHWIRNLYKWFDWLPDGAIQFARLKLLTAKTDDDIEAAIEALDDAWHRGVPFFAMGVSWMFEMMESLVVDDDSDDMCDRLRAIRRVASQLQPGQAVLTLRLDEMETTEKEPARVSHA